MKSMKKKKGKAKRKRLHQWRLGILRERKTGAVTSKEAGNKEGQAEMCQTSRTQRGAGEMKEEDTQKTTR